MARSAGGTVYREAPPFPALPLSLWPQLTQPDSALRPWILTGSPSWEEKGDSWSSGGSLPHCLHTRILQHLQLLLALPPHLDFQLLQNKNNILGFWMFLSSSSFRGKKTGCLEQGPAAPPASLFISN